MKLETGAALVTEPKEDVLTALFDEWAVLTDLLTPLTDEQWHTATVLPGWTVRDTVAHIIGTESMLDGRPTPPCAIDVAELAHVRNPIAQFNEQWVIALRTSSSAEILQMFIDVTAKRKTDLTNMSDAELEKESSTPIGPAPYLSFMGIRVFDCWMHELDIRDALNLPGDEGTHAAAVAFTQVENSLGYVIGKRGKAPAGSRIQIDLTGPLPRTYRIAVDDRARLVESFDQSPTATISLDSRLFSRLGGGRTNANEHSAAITLTGDVDMASKIVGNLAFTI